MLTMKTVLCVLFLGTLLFQGTTGYKVTGHYPIGGTGGFDYIAIDSSARRLYVSHATQVEVLDADSGKLIGTIPDTPGVHGAAIASAFKHGFTSNGRENKVSMFDSVTLALIKKIDVGKGPDGIYYDPESKRVFTNNHGSHDITAIDAKTGEVVGTVQAKGDGEQAVIGDDVIYVNSEDTAEVLVFDPKSLEVKKRFPIGVAKTPTGLAYDAKTKRLFIGCRNEPKMVVMDAVTGKVINSYPIGAGVDYAGFDPDAKLIFFSWRSRRMSTKTPERSQPSRVRRRWPSIRRQRRFFFPQLNTLKGRRPSRAGDRRAPRSPDRLSWWSLRNPSRTAAQSKIRSNRCNSAFASAYKSHTRSTSLSISSPAIWRSGLTASRW